MYRNSFQSFQKLKATNNIFKKLSKIANNIFKKISVTNDYTMEERSEIIRCIQEAKEKNNRTQEGILLWNRKDAEHQIQGCESLRFTIPNKVDDITLMIHDS